MGKKRIISLLNLIFLVPVIILSFFTWNDYRHYLRNVTDYFPSMEQIYLLDGGKQLLGLSKDETLDQEYDVYLWDTATKAVLAHTVIPTDFQGWLGPTTYQQDGILIPTFNSKASGLQLNLIHPGGTIDELAQGTLPLPSAIGSNLFSWRGRLLTAGNLSETEWVMAQVKDGKLVKVNLLQEKLLPARPVRLSEVTGAFGDGQSVPMFTVSLKDDRTALVSGILDSSGKPAVQLIQKDESSFKAEDQATLQFAKRFGINNAKQVRVQEDYPRLAAFYNDIEKKWGAAVPTPEPVYQALVFPLNDDELLIAGSTTEDELDGAVTGYIFNERNGEFQDATLLLKQLAYDQIKDSDTGFYKRLGSSTLYYSSEDLAGYTDLELGQAKIYTNQQAEGWLMTDNDTRVSLESFWNYAKLGERSLSTGQYGS